MPSVSTISNQVPKVLMQPNQYRKMALNVEQGSIQPQVNPKAVLRKMRMEAMTQPNIQNILVNQEPNFLRLDNEHVVDLNGIVAIAFPVVQGVHCHIEMQLNFSRIVVALPLASYLVQQLLV